MVVKHEAISQIGILTAWRPARFAPMIDFPYIFRGVGHVPFRGAIEEGRGFSFVTFLLPRQKKSKLSQEYTMASLH
jgi:hypothetical protein